MIELDTHELAWAAGFFDGEGCTSLNRRPSAPHPQINITQHNRQTLERFQKAVGGIGKITPPQEVYTGATRWQWYGTGFERTQAVIALLWIWLSEPKRAQARRVLAEANAHPPAYVARRRGLCPKGHQLTFRKGNSCDECGRQGDRAYKAARDPDEQREYDRRYRAENLERIRGYQRLYMRDRRAKRRESTSCPV